MLNYKLFIKNVKSSLDVSNNAAIYEFNLFYLY